MKIALIEQRTLVRDCLTHCIKLATGHDVVAFPSVESLLEVADDIALSLVVLCVTARPDDAEKRREVSLLAQASRLPIVILSDLEDPNVIVSALDQGARGYIPTTLTLEVAVNALRLVKAGGTFVPASSLLGVRRSAPCSVTPEQARDRLFTARQAAVVEALRRGKANKIIAYELNMRESTVKVHVRNIMRKLKARNRTEVAFMTNGLAIMKDAASMSI
jgi:DNA-binding NarL/FixJ family response regulator